MDTRQLVAAGSGALAVLGPPVGSDAVVRATDALYGLGYSGFSVALCERLRPRAWSCVIESSRTSGRFGWVRFHRADDGTFVVTERRAGQLVP
jgi:hypothetical protein